MEKFEKFYIEKIEFDKESLLAKFYYSFDKKVEFIEEIDFACDFQVRASLDKAVLENLLFHLSVALSISYYKLCPTKEIIVENGHLDDKDKEFWHTFFLNGLGEFFYKNDISPEGLFEFKTPPNLPLSGEEKVIKDFSLSKKYLLPIGGGKDSIVSSMMLEEGKHDYTPFIFGKIDAIKQDFLDMSGRKYIFIKRTLSPNLFTMNAEGYSNGHVPISGIISFVLTVVAYLYDYKYIVFSNERSADEENVMLGKLKVNHQYSKSLEFEDDMRAYIRKNISLELEYFSLLRGLYELKIAQIFASSGQRYFPIFSSCNKNFTILQKHGLHSRWCGECPKCLFVYMVLRPFLTTDQVMSIFGEELYIKPSLLPLFKELLGVSPVKPFECVGEKEESILATYLSLQKADIELPFLLEYFRDTLLPIYSEEYLVGLEKKYFGYTQSENIPPELQKSITKYG